MTEELEKEAEKYFKIICEDYNEVYERTGKRHYFVGFDIKNGYLAGAEPREKRIAELEKENADLKEEINKIAFARGTLEEENAELKGLKDVATLIRANNDTVTTLMQLNNMLVSKNQQLTKAKEIIKDLLSLCEGETDSKLVFTRAEQFLNSEVEK